MKMTGESASVSRISASPGVVRQQCDGHQTNCKRGHVVRDVVTHQRRCDETLGHTRKPQQLLSNRIPGLSLNTESDSAQPVEPGFRTAKERREANCGEEQQCGNGEQARESKSASLVPPR